MFSLNIQPEIQYQTSTSLSQQQNLGRNLGKFKQYSNYSNTKIFDTKYSFTLP
jgi:hypothetical protein